MEIQQSHQREPRTVIEKIQFYAAGLTLIAILTAHPQFDKIGVRA